MNNESPQPRRSRLTGILVAGGLAIAAAAVLRFAFPPQEDPVELLNAARAAFDGEKYAEAERLASECLEVAPESTFAMLLAGESAERQSKFVEAVQYFEQLPSDAPESVDTLVKASHLLAFELGRMTEAEALLRRVLAHHADDAGANFALVNLLLASARPAEATLNILTLLKQRSFTQDHLFALSGGMQSYRAPEFLHKCHEADPQQPSVLLGLAQSAINRGDEAAGQQLLEQATAIDPQFLAAQARLGTLLAKAAATEPFLNWQRQLPPEADSFPEVWLARAEWAERAGQFDVATRCWWEAARRDPNSPSALFHLAQLSALRSGDAPRAAPFAARLKLLQRLKELEAKFPELGPRMELMQELIATLESLGRHWEACGWCMTVLQNDSQQSWARQQLLRLAPSLQGCDTPTLDSANPALAVDLSDYPLPTAGAAAAAPRVAAAASPATISFENAAERAGLAFAYFNGSVAPQRKMYELTGGGAAVLDYDNDGWPDIYLTQGCAWPPREGQREHLDRLYRNRGDGTFEDVTADAGLVEDRFSQGAAAGDFDSDGFPDLLVANIGRNRLFLNNADGTFRDATVESGIESGIESSGVEPGKLSRAESGAESGAELSGAELSGAELSGAESDKKSNKESEGEGAGGAWTTSCLICDLNGDGLPDLYAVNYLAGATLFQDVCRGPDGAPVMCKPTHFDARQDQFLLNLGDGGFKDATAQAGFQAAGGKGLGVVAADFDGSNRLSLFIANDAVANFYFRNDTPQPGAEPKFVEQAYSSGLAFNGDGRAEGCMGIACGDSNGDGLLDLFVTNFYHESNTLYAQAGPLLFHDATRQARLERSGFPMLGFGAQFLDGDLDGKLDLLLTNGHVDDLAAYEVPYKMPAQFHHNQGPAFQLGEPEQLGEFFRERHLGRGMARLDWNRDGREDVVISHLDAPAALLTNSSQLAAGDGRFLVLHLRGVASSRDAIGAAATVTVGKESMMRQLTAGDGYQASNQRILTFGLGASAQADRLTVRWPSGRSQVFTDLPADREWLIVEGGQPVSLPR